MTACPRDGALPTPRGYVHPGGRVLTSRRGRAAPPGLALWREAREPGGASFQRLGRATERATERAVHRRRCTEGADACFPGERSSRCGTTGRAAYLRVRPTPNAGIAGSRAENGDRGRGNLPKQSAQSALRRPAARRPVVLGERDRQARARCPASRPRGSSPERLCESRQHVVRAIARCL
jgi:hypothetical protein